MAADDNEEIGLATTIGRIHREEEKIIEESGIPFTLLRPPAFMQNFITQFGYTIRTHNAFYVPAGDAKISFVDARDVAAVAVKALTCDSQQHMERHTQLPHKKQFLMDRQPKPSLMKLVGEYHI
jgi:uncharacterized protein YbjT (DUF2867 family)